MMKNIYLIVVIMCIYFNSTFSHNFEIIPVVYHLETVKSFKKSFISFDNTVIAFGNTGYLMVSENSGRNWQQHKVFHNGGIVNIFHEGEELIAFGNLGEIGISDNSGNNWVISKNLDDSLLAVTEYPGGYFVRAKERAFTLNNNFDIINEFSHYSPELKLISTVDKPDYRKSIAYFKNRLIMEIDSSNFIIFDLELNPIDTLSILKTGLIGISKSGYWIESDNSALYFRVVEVDKSVLKAYIFKTEDFESVEKFNNLRYSYSIFKIFNEQLYILNKDEYYLRDPSRFTIAFYSQNFKDFTIFDNKQIIVGNNKLIEIIDLKDSTLNVVSEISGYSPSIPPMQIKDDRLIFFSGANGEYYPYFWESKDNGLTFKPTINVKDPKHEVTIHETSLRFKYYDTINQKIYFGGRKVAGFNYLYETDDFCESFKSYPSEITYSPRNIGYSNAPYVPDININEDYYTLASGVLGAMDMNSTRRNAIYRLNKQFEVQSYFVDSSGIAIDYIHSLDTNTFIVHAANVVDRTSEIKYTTNQGQTWEMIYKYPINLSLSYFKEIQNKKRKFLTLIHADRTYSSDYNWMYMDVVDLQNLSFTRLKTWYPDSPENEKEFGHYGVGIESDENLVYISFQDTLFYIQDILDITTWHYQTLPTKGARIIHPLVKFGDKFFARYTDEFIPWSNMSFWIKPLDSLNTSVNEVADKRNYLYSYPPYPLPAINEVRSLIYWDTSIEIDVEQIAVYNIYGAKVAGPEKIRLDKLNAYSGNLVWDCSAVESGIYVIHLKHGTENRIIKAIVTR